jgi:hypothetical protein
MAHGVNWEHVSPESDETKRINHGLDGWMLAARAHGERGWIGCDLHDNYSAHPVRFPRDLSS